MKATIKITDGIIAIPGDKIQFKFDYDKSQLVWHIEDHIVWIKNDPKEVKEAEERMEYYKDFCRKEEDLLPYSGITLTGKFISYSRIDKLPIIEIDWNLADVRDYKINKILRKAGRIGLPYDSSNMASLLE